MSSPPLACQHWTIEHYYQSEAIRRVSCASFLRTQQQDHSFFRCLCKRECLLTRVLRMWPVVPWSKLSFWSWPLIALLWLTFNLWTLYSSSRDSIDLISSSSQQEKRYMWLRAVCLLLLRLCTQFGFLSISFPLDDYSNFDFLTTISIPSCPSMILEIFGEFYWYSRFSWCIHLIDFQWAFLCGHLQGCQAVCDRRYSNQQSPLNEC